MSKTKEKILNIVLPTTLITGFVIAAGYYKYDCLQTHETGAKECIMFPEEAIGYYWQNKQPTPK